MGFLPNGTRATVSAVNPSGRIAVGSGNTTGGVQRAFRWRKDETPEMQNLGVPNDYISSTATDLNNLGNFIVGYGQHTGAVNALRWRVIHEVLIDILESPQEAITCFATGTSGLSGSEIVGYCRLRNGQDNAVCWLEGTTEVTTLEGLETHSTSSAHAVSDDGNVIVGYSTQQNIGHAVRWTRNPGTNTFSISDLNVRPEPPQDTWRAIALGVNHDGTVIVGKCISGHGPINQIIEAFIWRADTTPQVQKLPDITPGYKRSIAYDVIKKDDGTIIAVGQSFQRSAHSSFQELAVRWNNLKIENLNFPS